MMEHDQRHNSPDLVELPLFPLNLVLFPGMRLPLHIFEERYKTMIGECIDSNSPFGVLLIKEGAEAGGTAEPFRVGTTARITQNTQLDGGRLNILTIGEKRFQLIEIIKTTPFIKKLNGLNSYQDNCHRNSYFSQNTTLFGAKQ